MILVFVDHAGGKIKKSAMEALTYGAELANQMGTKAEALVLGSCTEELVSFGNYGISKVHQVDNAELNQVDAQVYAKLIAQAAKETNATVLVFSHNQTGKAVAPRVSVALKAGLVSGAVALPDTSNGFTVKKSVFSGKAFAHISVQSSVKIVAINPNSFYVKTSENVAEVNQLNITIPERKVTTKEVKMVSGEVPLTEAEVVVSGGRGLKGPENWSLVEDLAKVLHAATACSRPVADAHWRPHHEHVGQTGFQIAPNLYFAIGISGAIQHLAGVNRSKTIVVINKDPEAPFFKAADYGVVGDAFDIVPRLTEEIRKIKSV
jgi:electron transfer flavoprotein alpha subunit